MKDLAEKGFEKELLDSITKDRGLSYVRRNYEKYMYHIFMMDKDEESKEIKDVKQKYFEYKEKLK